jgi:hypothetical protein
VKLFKHCPALRQAWSLRWILTGIFEAAETRYRLFGPA